MDAPTEKTNGVASLPADREPVILYVDCRMDIGIDRMRREGLRRFADARKWRVETLEHADCTPDALRDALARLRPIGCAAECWRPGISMPPALFGRVPVVYFGRRDGPGWRKAPSVECDDALVARLAFKELSATNPPAYAIATYHVDVPWAGKRIETFRDCCRKAGFDCPVAHFPAATAEEYAKRPGLMAFWAAALPHRCAVFTVNDYCALGVATALAAAGRSYPRTVTFVGADGAEVFPMCRELMKTISTIRLDFELAGYLAARLLADLAMKGRAEREMKGRAEHEMKGRAGHEMKGRAEHEMKGAACAANEFNSSFAPPAHASFGGNAATLHCGNAATSFAPPAHTSFDDGGGTAATVAVFPPLMVSRSKSTFGYGRREPRILEAVETIRREACDGLTVAALAARFPGTRRLFDMRFREAVGHSALDEILNVRLERAMDLLARSDMPIGAVAHFSGFKTEWEFWKIFKKRTGEPPLLFRRARR